VPIEVLAWAPNGKVVATSSADGRMLLWDVASGRVQVERELGRLGRLLRWSATGETIALGGTETLLEGDAAYLDAEPWISSDSPDDMLAPAGYVAFGDTEAEVEINAELLRETVAPFEKSGALTHVHIVDAMSLEHIGTLGSSRVTGPPTDIAWSGDDLLFTAQSRGVGSWRASSGHFLGYLQDSSASDYTALALSSDGARLAGGTSSVDAAQVTIWNAFSGQVTAVLDSETVEITCATYSPKFARLAVGGTSGLVEVWDTVGEEFERQTLEGHTAPVATVSFSHDGRFLATCATDGVIKIWDTLNWTLLSQRRDRSVPSYSCAAVFSPTQHELAAVTDGGCVVRVWQIDPPTLRATRPPQGTIHYTNAKVVLLGDASVGKTGLGLVLSRQDFRATDSTHRRNVWMLSSESDSFGTDVLERREVFLWDLAGQPGYRLLHQLHLLDVAVALIVFDARNDLDPLSGVRYWSRALTQAERQLDAGGMRIQRILVAARTDRGGAMVGDEELRDLRARFGLERYITTSAKEGEGIAELRTEIEAAIDWNALPKISSTGLFDSIRLFLQEKSESEIVLATETELRDSFARTGVADADDIRAEFRTCVERAQARGLVRRLSFGRLILLKPELLDAYAAAALHAAGAAEDGLGAIAEDDVREGRFSLPADDRLEDREMERLLLIATVEDLLRHEVALREESAKGSYLVFPTQTKRTLADLTRLVPWGRFDFEGPLQHIWATLVVRLAHSGVFNRHAIGVESAVFRGLGRLVGLQLEALEEGQGAIRLFTEHDESETEPLLRSFVEEHLVRRALRHTVRFSSVVACGRCGFVAPDELLKVIAPATVFNCPSCPGRIDLRAVVISRDEDSPPDTSDLHQSADRERLRDAARTAVQGKEVLHEFDAFLAHNSHDKDAVVAVSERLRDLGLNPWLDRDEIPPGRWFQDVLQDAVYKVGAAAIFVGERGLGRWQALELKVFVSQCVDRGIPVIPVLLPGASFPPEAPFLKELQSVEFEDSIEEAAPFARLVWGITGDREQYERLSMVEWGVTSEDAQALVRRAVLAVLDEVPALTTMKLVVGVELRGRGATHRLRVRLPAIEVTAGSAQDARVQLRMSRVFLRRMLRTAKLADWREAVRDGSIQASGEDAVLAVIVNVVEECLAQEVPPEAGSEPSRPDG
jgi:WD40 repeat protein